MLGKQHKVSFPKSTFFRASNVLEIFHSDICGPMQNQSISGYYYFSTLLMIIHALQRFIFLNINMNFLKI
jgi:hypothetical protein